MKKLFLLSAIAYLSFLNATNATDLYWIGNSGNWSDNSHWSHTSGGSSCGCVPTSNDNVFFDANSFSSVGQTITIDQQSYCKDMTWAGVSNTPNLGGSSELDVYGSFTLSANMNLTYSGLLDFRFNTITASITTAGKTLSTISFDGTGAWTLQDALTTNYGYNINLNTGSLNTNGQYVKVYKFISNGSGIRSLTLGSSTIECSYPGNPYYNDYSCDLSGTNLTVNAGTSLLKFTGTPGVGNFGSFALYDIQFTNNNTGALGQIQGSTSIHDISFAGDGTVNAGGTINNVTFAGNGTIGGSCTFNNVSIAGNGYINSSNTFNNLTLTSGKTYNFANTTTQTITGTLTANGSCSTPVGIYCTGPGSVSATFSKPGGAITVDYVRMQNIHATGGAVFTANNVTDLGGNTGWTLNTPAAKTLYWIGNTGNWSDVNHWSLSSGGISSGCAPTLKDNVIFDANSFTSVGQPVTIDQQSYCNNMTWAGVSNTPTLGGGYELDVYGSFTLSANMNLTYNGLLDFKSSATGNTITTAGKILGTIDFDGTGAWTLQDALTTNYGYNINLNTGSLNTNGQYVKVYKFISNGSGIRSLTLGSSTIECSYPGNPYYNDYSCDLSGTNLTVNAGTSLLKFTGTPGVGNFGSFALYDIQFTNNNTGALGQIQGSTSIHDISFAGDGTVNAGGTINNVTFAGNGTIGGSCTFNNVSIAGNGYINSSNTFNNLTLTSGKTYNFANTTTQTITGTLTANGSCSTPVGIYCTGPGSVSATFSKPGGAITVDYVRMQNIHSTGGAVFTANNVTDLGGNTGWTLNTPAAKTLYWIGNTGNWSDVNHWSLSSGGISSGCAPTLKDNVIFDANSFTSVGQPVTIDQQSYCNNMTWAGVSNTPTLGGGYELDVYGSFTLSANMNLTYNGLLDFKSSATGNTITTAGKILGTIDFDGTGAWTLQDALTTNYGYNINLNTGSLNTNGQYVKTYLFISNGSGIRSLTLGSSTIECSGNNNSYYNSNYSCDLSGANLTVNAGTSLFKFTGNYCGGNFGSFALYDLQFTNNTTGALGQIQGSTSIHDISFAGDGTVNAGGTINNVTFAGNGTIGGSCTFNNVSIAGNGYINSSNTFNNLTLTSGKTYNFANTTTQTITGTLTANGSCSTPVGIYCTGPGSVSATFSKPGGAITVDYVRMQNIHATGGAVFTANNVTDLGGNTGWTLNTPAAKTLYWIGNTGNWSDVNHWSLSSGGISSGCAPTLKDNVIFDANSFTSVGQPVTIDQQSYCNNMTWAGVSNTPTLGGGYELDVYGSFTLSANMNLTYNGLLDFKSSATGNTITTAGKILGTIDFDGTGAWTLQDALTTNYGYNIILNTGSLNTNGQYVKTYLFISNGSGIRSLTLGSSTIECSGNNNSYYNSNYSCDLSGANLTVNAGTSLFKFTGNYCGGNFGSFALYDLQFTNNTTGALGQIQGSPTSIHDVSFAGNGNWYVGSTSNNITFAGDGTIGGSNTFNNVSIAGNGSINSSNTFNNLTLASGKTYNFGNATTQTITGTLTANGSCSTPVGLYCTGGTTAFSKPGGAITVNYVRMQNIHSTGGAVFTANNVTDLGGNTGWTLNTPASQTLYWIGNSGNWTDANHWSTSSGGSSGSCIPNIYDNVVFDGNSFSGGGQNVIIDMQSYCKNITWTGVSNTPTLGGSQELDVYGSLTLSANMNLTYNGLLDFKSSATGNTITTGGKTLSTINFDGTGAWTLQDALTTNYGYNIILNTGSLNTNGQYVKTYLFISNGSGIRSLTLGSSTIECSGNNNSYYNSNYSCDLSGANLTVNAGTSLFKFTGNYCGGNFGSFALYDLQFTNNTTGALGQIQGSPTSIHDVSFAGNAQIYVSTSLRNLTLGTSASANIGGPLTINGNFTCNGASGSLASINGGTISKPSGIVCINYVNITNSTVTGGATFYAGNSHNLGNNSGWLFQSCASPYQVPYSTAQYAIKPNGNQLVVAEPIQLGTGTYSYEHTDVKTQTINESLNFTRFYNSLNRNVPGPLGYGWSHTYNFYVVNNADTLWNLHYPDGHVCTFIPMDIYGHSFSIFSGTTDSLQKNNNKSYSLFTKEKLEYHFDSTGKLDSIIDLNNNVTKLYYTSNVLDSIVGPGGRSLALTYYANKIASVKDPMNRVCNYSYDANDNLISVEDANSGTAPFTYDSVHNMLTAVNPLGYLIVSNTYDSTGKVISQKDAYNQVTSIVYNFPDSGDATVTNPDNSQMVAHHDSYIRKTSEKDELGFTKTFAYDANSNENAFVNENNKSETRLFDNYGNVLSDNLPGSKITNIIYNSFNSPVQVTDAKGNQKIFYYNPINNNLDSIRNPDNSLQVFYYDNNGQLIKSVDGNGNETTFTYSPAGDLLSTQTFAGIKQFEYDSAGRKVSETDENGHKTTYQYDNNNNILKITDALGRTIVNTYDADNQLLSVRDKKGFITKYAFDKKGRKVSSTNPQGGVTTYVYDVRDNLKSVTDPDNKVVSYTYDNKGRKKSATNALGTTQYFYDGVGNLTEIIDPTNKRTQYTYSPTNKKLSQQDGLGNTTNYGYDLNDNLTSVTDPLNRATIYSYDGMNRLDSVLDAAGKTTAVTYDKSGNKKSVTDPNGHQQMYSYDGSNRMINYQDAALNNYFYSYDSVGNNKILTKPTGTIAKVFDAANRAATVNNSTGDNYHFTYDNDDNVISMSNNVGTTNMAYDSLNQLIKYTDPYSKVVSFTYDAAGNKTSVTYPGGNKISYSYDNANNLKSVTDWLNHTFNYTYDPAGRIMQLLYPNGAQCNYGFDNAGRLISKINALSNNAVISGSTFTLDAIGNRIKEQRLGLSPSALSSLSRPYSYAKDDGMLSDSIWSFVNDHSGNRTSETNGINTATYTFSVDNLLNSWVDTIGTASAYSYDPLGHRIARIVGLNSSRYVLDVSNSLSQILQITDGNGAVQSNYIYGAGLLESIDASNNALYYHFDAQHNTTALTDQNSLIKSIYTYDPFGAMLTHAGTTNQPFTFLGEYGVEQESSSIYYARARYYDAANGRFISKDANPYDLNNPQTINRYVYVTNNPLINFDFTGLFGNKDYGGSNPSYLGNMEMTNNNYSLNSINTQNNNQTNNNQSYLEYLASHSDISDLGGILPGVTDVLLKSAPAGILSSALEGGNNLVDILYGTVEITKAASDFAANVYYNNKITGAEWGNTLKTIAVVGGGVVAATFVGTSLAPVIAVGLATYAVDKGIDYLWNRFHVDNVLNKLW